MEWAVVSLVPRREISEELCQSFFSFFFRMRDWTKLLPHPFAAEPHIFRVLLTTEEKALEASVDELLRFRPFISLVFVIHRGYLHQEEKDWVHNLRQRHHRVVIKGLAKSSVRTYFLSTKKLCGKEPEEIIAEMGESIAKQMLRMGIATIPVQPVSPIKLKQKLHSHRAQKGDARWALKDALLEMKGRDEETEEDAGVSGRKMQELYEALAESGRLDNEPLPCAPPPRRRKAMQWAVVSLLPYDQRTQYHCRKFFSFVIRQWNELLPQPLAKESNIFRVWPVGKEEFLRASVEELLHAYPSIGLIFVIHPGQLAKEERKWIENLRGNQSRIIIKGLAMSSVYTLFQSAEKHGKSQEKIMAEMGQSLAKEMKRKQKRTANVKKPSLCPNQAQKACPKHAEGDAGSEWKKPRKKRKKAAKNKEDWSETKGASGTMNGLDDLENWPSLPSAPSSDPIMNTKKKAKKKKKNKNTQNKISKPLEART